MSESTDAPTTGERTHAPPSLGIAVGIGAVVGVAALWLFVGYQLGSQSESWAGIAGVVLTPFAAACGGLAGALVHAVRAFRFRNYVQRDAPVHERTPHDGVALSLRVRWFAFAAAALVVVCALSVATRPYGATASTKWLSTLVGAAAVLPFVVVVYTATERATALAAGFATGVAWLFTLLLIFMILDATSLRAAITRTPSDLSRALTDFYTVAASGTLLPLAALMYVSVTLARTLSPMVGGTWTHAGTRSPWRFAMGAGGALAYFGACVPVLVAANEHASKTNAVTERVAQVTMRNVVEQTTQTLFRMVNCIDVDRHARSLPQLPATMSAMGSAGRSCLIMHPPPGVTTWRIPEPIGRPNTPQDDGFWVVAQRRDGSGPVLYADATGAIYSTYFFARADSLRRLLNGVRDSVRDFTRARAIADSILPLPVTPPLGTSLTPVASAVWPLLELRECVRRELLHLPTTPAASPCAAHHLPSGDFSDMPLSVYANIDAPDRTLVGHYVVRVAWNRAQGDTVFSLTARPNLFAVDGLRSLLVDSAGVVHFTVEDRAASIHDRPVPACEQSGQSCVHGVATGAK